MASVKKQQWDHYTMTKYGKVHIIHLKSPGKTKWPISCTKAEKMMIDLSLDAHFQHFLYQRLNSIPVHFN